MATPSLFEPSIALKKNLRSGETYVASVTEQRLPLLGFGTYQIANSDAFKVVTTALKQGYRHIDTASIYRNEKAIGDAIRASGIPRKELFITSKLAPTQQGYDEALKACQESLEKLQIDYLDLYLIHWPGASKTKPESPENAAKRENSWKALENLFEEGKCKAIGVSNFYVSHLQEMERYARLLPFVNQVELHPYLQQRELVKYCNSKGIQVEAYTSLGQGELLKDEVVRSVASRNNRSPSQVLLRWAVQRGIVVLPRSEKEKNIINNSQIFDFELSFEDFEKLDSMERDLHYCWDPTKIQ